MGNLKKQGRSLSIKRPATPTEMTESIQISASIHTSPTATGGINLASAEIDTDPFRKSLISAGYIILDENEYGAVVRLDKGKPTFIPKTKQGFDPNEKEVRNSVLLPEHVDTAMKVYAAKMRMSTTQYLTQLIIADLRKNENI